MCHQTALSQRSTMTSGILETVAFFSAAAARGQAPQLVAAGQGPAAGFLREQTASAVPDAEVPPPGVGPGAMVFFLPSRPPEPLRTARNAL